jgi:simple sugar transport system ATP-binding protein
VTPVLRAEGLSKSFGSVEALRDAGLSVFPGEVVALLGDNGAGKSTLIKCIAGIHRPDAGRVWIDGREVAIRTPRDAIEAGIETIHQDSSLAPDLSIMRNLFLGREPVLLAWLGPLAPLDRRGMREAARRLLARVGIRKALAPGTAVLSLSGGERQSIAISRAMQFAARLIILDEPTNNLGVEETRGVLRFIREMKAAGHALLVITHNIHHVFAVADRFAVMRRGRVVAEGALAGTDVLAIERLITGSDIGTEAGR